MILRNAIFLRIKIMEMEKCSHGNIVAVFIKMCGEQTYTKPYLFHIQNVLGILDF